MKWVGVIQAYLEGGRIGGAVESLFAAGCQSVYVLDGGWRDEEGRVFGGGPCFSDDGTIEEAEAAGARVKLFLPSGIANAGACSSDAIKQTALLAGCSADYGDMVIRIDADEVLRGTLPDAACHSMVMLHNHGENDIPGVRSTFPRGDDANQPIPLLRAFAWRSDLVCVRPGRWETKDGPLEPYLVGALSRLIDTAELDFTHPLSIFYRGFRDDEHLLAPADTVAFPILDGVWIDHYRNAEKADAKRSYYEAVA